MPSVKEVRDHAILETSKERHIRDFTTVHWNWSLTEFEDIVVGCHRDPNAEFPARYAEKLLQHVEHNSGFMLAVIFNKTHDAAVVLPLPEVFTSQNRVALGTSAYSSTSKLEEIVDKVHYILDDQAVARAGRDSKDIVIIQQNLGSERDIYGLTIGSWNAEVAKKHALAIGYDDWIREVQHDLDAPVQA